LSIAVEIGEYEDHEMAAKAKELLIMLPIILHGVVRVQLVPSFSLLETFLYGCFDRKLLKAALCQTHIAHREGWRVVEHLSTSLVLEFCRCLLDRLGDKL
jgi:hypothetical protein